MRLFSRYPVDKRHNREWLVRIRLTLFSIAIAGGLAMPWCGQADDTADSINVLKQQIEALDQKVRILERQRELGAESADAAAKETPTVTLGNNGLSVNSADKNFVIQLHGVVQVDNRSFFNDGGIQGNDGILLRRARPILQGTVYRDFDFFFQPDFGGSSVQIFDAFMDYHYSPWLRLRIGKLKTPVGLEQLQSDVAISFNERSLATDLVPNRDIGFELWGDFGDGRLSYAAGVFNGVGDARNSSNADFEDHREFAGRFFLQPFKQTGLAALEGLGFGVGGSWGNTFSNAAGLPATTGGTLAGFTTDGQQQFFAYNPTNGTVVANGDHWRISPQGYYYWGPFDLMGEYVISHQQVSKGAMSAGLENTAWEVSAGWVLTGEDASFSGVTPKRPFDLAAGHWGSVQLVGRYAALNLDKDSFPVFANPGTSASAAHAWAVGLNWYLNKNIRMDASFSRTTFTGGGGAGTAAPAIVTRQPEEVFFTRLQLAF